mmetsp:Transcript_17225/g.2850  ORF Transcript_17225/g.2850 Transcript_17225/m.2850 type:complete len:84 (-) Transcript_17225:1079-1330(-)
MEVQIFHHNNEDMNDRVVVSVCFEVAFQASGFAHDMLQGMRDEYEIDLMDAFDNIEILGNYFMYEGSLTYYPCDEGYNWVVWR